MPIIQIARLIQCIDDHIGYGRLEVMEGAYLVLVFELFLTGAPLDTLYFQIRVVAIFSPSLKPKVLLLLGGFALLVIDDDRAAPLTL